MSKIIKIGLAMLIAITSVGIFPSLVTTAAATATEIDSSTSTPYTVGADIEGKVEDVIPAQFVQNNTKKPNFEKVNIQSYSSEIGSTANGIYPTADGNFITMVFISNFATGAQKLTPASVLSVALIKVDSDGNILATKMVANGVNDLIYRTDQDSFLSGEQASPAGFMQQDGNSFTVYYNGQAPGDTAIINRQFTFDQNLNGSWQAIDTNGYAMNQSIWYISQINNQTFQHGFMDASSVNQNTFDFYGIDSATGKYTSHFQLEAPVYESIRPTKVANWFLTSGVNSAIKRSNGEMISVVTAGDHSYNKPTTMGVYVWDASGQIKYEYVLGEQQRFVFEPNISDQDHYYFIEFNEADGTSKLQLLDPNTGSVTTKSIFPYGTNIQISPSVDATYGTSYKFIGGIESATGQFAGDAIGAVTGTMNADFSVYNFSVVQANDWVRFDGSSDTGASGVFMVSGATMATDFSQEPSNGWQSQAALSSQDAGNAFFGSMRSVDDYAPALAVGGPVVINKDTVGDWDTALLAGVEVKDTFDLNPNGGNQTQAWLDARRNRNPLNTSLAIDWEALGLDKTVVGPNVVSYFITDSAKQQTSDSKLVNVTAKTTDTDTDNKIALDASNFSVNLSDVESLTETTVKDSDHSKVKAWDMLDGSDVTAQITVDTVQLEVIRKATIAQPYPLTYTVSKNGVEVSNEVTVFVTDDNTKIENNIVLYANDFSIHLTDAKTVTGEETKTLAQAAAYAFDTGELLSANNITANASNLNAATTVGPVDVVVTYSDGDSTATTVIGSVIDDNTTIDPNETLALYAKNFSVDLTEVNSLNSTNVQDADHAATYAWSMKDGSDLSTYISVDESQLDTITNATIAQPYPLTFTVSNAGVEISNEVTVFVTDDNTKIENNVVLYAKDFTMKLSDAPSASSEQAINLSEAVAYDFNTGSELAHTNISADVQALNTATAVGPVDVEISYTDGTSTVTIVVASLIDENTIVDPDNSEALYAKGFIVDITDVPALDDVAIINAANARAWNLSNGSAVTFTTTYDIQAEVGAYPVTFTTTAGTSKTVFASVVDENTIVDNDNDEALHAQSFSVEISEVAELDETAVISAANAKAWNLTNGEVVSFTTTYDIPAEVGAYPVTFTTVAGTTKTVYASVIDNNTIVDSDNGEAIYATGFSLYTDEVAELDEAAIMNKTHVKAWNLDTGLALAVTVDAEILAIPGTYTVTFTTALGTVKTVNVEVLAINYGIEAQDIYLTTDELYTLQQNGSLEAYVVEAAEAHAWEEHSGKDVNPVHADVSQIVAATASGVYQSDMYLTTTNTATGLEVVSATTTINVIVTDTNNGLPITGQNHIIILLAGFITLISGIVVFFFNKRKQSHRI